MECLTLPPSETPSAKDARSLGLKYKRADDDEGAQSDEEESVSLVQALEVCGILQSCSHTKYTDELSHVCIHCAHANIAHFCTFLCFDECAHYFFEIMERGCLRAFDSHFVYLFLSGFFHVCTNTLCISDSLLVYHGLVYHGLMLTPRAYHPRHCC